ncbi:hypothetical protein [Colwellia sp. E2M01]|uniref:hypothetical protein n=1 Tax=Colwellia sp. E2M01 TaxID=2841561 RepID=UPI001C08C9E3|nr:hypothetical protein [Colwellia sp. E2M01]MBU2869452.1 hypothetical protein [Colwellia sp. E2M01]
MFKKLICTSIVLSTVALAGCQTSSAIKSASADGMSNMLTCDKIENTFDAYEQDKTSFSKLEAITSMVGIDSSSFDNTQAASYYNTVKSGVNSALAMKGCNV